MIKNKNFILVLSMVGLIVCGAGLDRAYAATSFVYPVADNMLFIGTDDNYGPAYSAYLSIEGPYYSHTAGILKWDFSGLGITQGSDVTSAVLHFRWFQISGYGASLWVTRMGVDTWDTMTITGNNYTTEAGYIAPYVDLAIDPGTAGTSYYFDVDITALVQATVGTGQDDLITFLLEDASQAVKGQVFESEYAQANGLFYPDAPSIEINVVLPWIEGDANLDGVVSAGDFASVQSNFGNTGAAGGGLEGDANHDGAVSAGDFASVQSNFGNTNPEPATLGLLAMGLIAVFRRRRSK